MDSVDKETALYIITYFGKLMNPLEKAALRHHHSTIKLEGEDNESRTKLYYRTGWLSDDPEVLNLLKDGPDQFMINCAERVLKESGDKVFLNFCPNCGKLARTPYAKQCTYCQYDWH
ncbi:MAG: hypothetical protein ACHQF4_08860 [Sphingobacteriales bacterium]